MYQEAITEYEKSNDKDAMRLANTLEKIVKLEDYAITERMGMEINTKNRTKIRRKIEKLQQLSDS
jgi:hypothetical protein